MKDDRKELEETKKQNGSGDDENIVMGNSEIPKSLEEVIDTIPDKEQASVIRRVMSMQFGMISNTPENSISKKINSEHITQYIETSKEAMEKEYKEKHEAKVFQGFVFTICCIVFVLVIVLLKNQPDYMEKIIYALFGFGAGICGGYGIGYKKGSNE
ncbi:MAG: hypothetical protein HFI88_00440 [Lachnospiraceae bacterium]|nr:hypothetical protein [Lachnospiraceae bacterium]